MIKKYSKKFWLPGVLILSAALQFTNMSRSSIWHDEGFTAMLVKKFSYLEIIARTARDVHPPLYYLLLKPWTSLFGYSEGLYGRLVPSLCSVLLLLLTYY